MEKIKKFIFILTTILFLVVGCTPKEPVQEENNDIYVTDITLSERYIYCKVNETGNIGYTYLPTNATKKDIQYYTSNTNIITLEDNGDFIAISEGKVTVTVLDNISNTYSQCEVTVNGVYIPPLPPKPIDNPDPIVVDENADFNVFCLEQKGSYGDGTLYKYGDIEILVDGGTTDVGPQLKELLETQCSDHKLEMIVSSHPHSDHFHALAISGQSTLSLAGITMVDYIVDSGVNDGKGDSNYRAYWINNIQQYYKNLGATYYPIQELVKDHHDDAIIKFNDNLEVQFFDTEHYYVSGGSAGNGVSVAMAIRYKNYNFFTFGDLPSGSESGILKYDTNVLYSENDINILKASHHASNGANTSDIVNKLKPSYSWASSAITSSNQSIDGIRQQHPYADASRRIVASTGISNYYWVGTCGTIHIKIDNTNGISFTGLGRKNADYYYHGQLVDPNSEKNTPFFETMFAHVSPYI